MAKFNTVQFCRDVEIICQRVLIEDKIIFPIKEFDNLMSLQIINHFAFFLF